MKKILIITFIRLYSMDSNNKSKNMLHFFKNISNNITNNFTKYFNQLIDNVKQEGLWQVFRRNKISITSSVIIAAGLYKGIQVYNKKPQNATLVNKELKNKLQKYLASLNINNKAINDIHKTAHADAIEYIKKQYHNKLKELFNTYDEIKKKLESKKQNNFPLNVQKQLTNQDQQLENITEAINRKGTENNSEYQKIKIKYKAAKNALINQFTNIAKEDITKIKESFKLLSMSYLHTLYDSYFQSFEKTDDFNKKKFYKIFKHTSKESKMKQENKFLNELIVTIYNQEYNRQYRKAFYTKCKEYEEEYSYLAKYFDVL